MKYDFIIIGSGFGGSVSAMRLAQKGYTVLVLEKGLRYNKKDFPKTNYNLFKFLWAPILKCFGIQQITLLKGVMVLHGAGVGGGSLVYANTLMEPEENVFDSWPKSVSWKSELKPYYELAKRMLGVTKNPILEESDMALKELSKKMGFEKSYHATDVGVFFGKPGQEVADPYFSGLGPRRVGCTGCGACMIGCRVGAKNTLDQNYLYFAEKWGAKVRPMETVTQIKKENKTYFVYTKKTNNLFKTYKYEAQKVILSAGVIGTLKILFKNKEVYKTLSQIPSSLGHSIRTNGESLLGSTSFEDHRDLSRGIAIGSAFHPDQQTKIEAVRYPSGSGFMRFLAVPLTENGTWWGRPLKLLKNIFLNFKDFIKLNLVKDWAKQSVILLVMQSRDYKMSIKRSFWGLTSKGDSLPSYIPIAQNAATELSKILNGTPQNVFSEVLFKTPATAHILGGAVLSESLQDGVVNTHHEVYGYPGLYICDGSVIPSNLGVNPSLTITALSERFCAQFEPKNLDLYSQRQIRFS